MGVTAAVAWEALRAPLARTIENFYTRSILVRDDNVPLFVAEVRLGTRELHFIWYFQVKNNFLEIPCYQLLFIKYFGNFK